MSLFTGSDASRITATPGILDKKPGLDAVDEAHGIAAGLIRPLDKNPGMVIADEMKAVSGNMVSVTEEKVWLDDGIPILWTLKGET